jgi:hypothetical protein
MSTHIHRLGRERGSGLIVVILIVAFMLAVGMVLLTVTGTSPQVSDSMRLQGMAFDSAEAGFNAAWVALNDGFNSGLWTSFAGRYKTTYEGAAFDDPAQPATYFRSLTDEQIVANCVANPDPNTIIFNSEPLATDPRCSFTVFLVSDEPPNTIAVNDNDAILLCIGKGPRNTYKRLEILIECPQ